ncbi:MAG: extracellular solute-binding protein, partial [Anaerolineales bacterium]|nr:extracellular solute-binding protein [Anaerolineales bacterium]
ACGGDTAGEEMEAEPTAETAAETGEEPDPAEPDTEEDPMAQEPDDEEMAESGDQQTLLWGMWGSPEEIATHQLVADAYMEANPNVTVELWAQPWGDYFTKLQTLWAAGDDEAIPDVLFLSPVPQYAADGVLEPLDSYIDASGYDVGDYWNGAIDIMKYDGNIYGFPRDIGLEVLYYNKDHFDEAGLDYPDASWTWDDLRAAAEALTITSASGRVER